MARADSLKRLQNQLLRRRSELLATFQDEIRDLRHERDGDIGGDDADAATFTVTVEIVSQLAERESRELRQIEHALRRFHAGEYGTCELCDKAIPVARLQALPYTSLCIDCQRKVEKDPELAEQHEANWSRVFDTNNTADEMNAV